jgi:tetratricopeptide (TPR) repeat protein
MALREVQQRLRGARDCRPDHGLRASLLLRLGRTSEAERTITEALRLSGNSADACDGLAFVSMQLGEHERANHLYRRATELAPHDPRFLYNLACSERSLGRLLQAEAACERAIRIDPAHFASYLLRSELRVQSSDSNHIADLRQLLERQPNDYRGRLFLGYALGKELDDIGRFDEAFGAFAQAAAARRARLDYDVATDERKLQRIASVYDGASLRDPATVAPGEPDGVAARFIFIVGLPRSGTTLLERILTGLPGVRSNGETNNFAQALMGAARGDGDVFARARAADPAAVAAEYCRLALPGAAAQTIIEKLPLNYLYVGAIRRALPQARILLVSREPLDSCFAMYRTLFAGGYPFSYDLSDLGRYYAAYARLMQHWRAHLGAQLHEISYAQLVRQPRESGAAVAAHCGLVWQDAAVDIEHNSAVSLTASASQVRRPIYGSSSGRWRHYRGHLGALIDTLRSAGIPLAE